MTTQQPMTRETVFDGFGFRTNDGCERVTYFFDGHLDAEQIAELYFATYPEHRAQYPHAVDVESVRHAWHVFTYHEDDCYLVAAFDPQDPFTDDDYFLCSCVASGGREEGASYEHREPHPASEHTPGAIPVTWVDIPMTDSIAA
ncbi:hypothetical protein [Streptomyces formicae]